MPTWFITGTSRGIGLGLVEYLLKDEANFVIASARNTNVEGLQKLKSDRLALITLDVADGASVEAAVKATEAVAPNGIDYFVNNAGVHPQPEATWEDLDYDKFEYELKFNTLYTLRVSKAFLPLVRKGTVKKVIFLTSAIGSKTVADIFTNVAITYSVSKAALNMLARKLSAVWKLEGIAVGLIHPGWVETTMGNYLDDWVAETKKLDASSKLKVEDSAIGVVKVIKDNVTLETSSTYYNYDGTTWPW